ncbi:hypothetical protein [Nitrosococcus oceani]|uniref:hypothetical protein n=1 Tax=Nitrosococcus oceani TaxID=1229 RepID=UPI0012E0260F|nr:hypothetical protein [Nitrosococcus oceani]
MIFNKKYSLKSLKVVFAMSGILIISTLVPPKDAEAALSLFSRANCAGVNESISWDPWASNWLWTDSYHYHNGTFKHIISTGWAYTWRSRAGHQNEGWGGWFVSGAHWRWSSSIGTYWMGSTSATDCNLSQW